MVDAGSRRGGALMMTALAPCRFDSGLQQQVPERDGFGARWKATKALSSLPGVAGIFKGIFMETIYLSGSENVQRAGSVISSAASDMIRAANIIAESVYSFGQQIDRLEQLLEKVVNELPQGS